MNTIKVLSIYRNIHNNPYSNINSQKVHTLKNIRKNTYAKIHTQKHIRKNIYAQKYIFKTNTQKFLHKNTHIPIFISNNTYANIHTQKHKRKYSYTLLYDKNSYPGALPNLLICPNQYYNKNNIKGIKKI